MPKLVLTHAVADVKYWASKHSERAEVFAPYATNLVDYTPADDSNVVALSMDVHDMEGLQSMLETPEAAAAKEAHGVLDPVSAFVQSS